MSSAITPSTSNLHQLPADIIFQVGRFLPQKDQASLVETSRKIFSLFCEDFMQKLGESYPALRSVRPDSVWNWMKLKEVLNDAVNKSLTVASHRDIKPDHITPLFIRKNTKNFELRFFSRTLTDLHQIAYIGSRWLGSPDQGHVCCDGIFCRLWTDQAAHDRSVRRIKAVTEPHQRNFMEFKNACDANDLVTAKRCIQPLRAHINTPPFIQLLLRACERKQTALIRMFIKNGASLMNIPTKRVNNDKYLRPGALQQLLDGGIVVNKEIVNALSKARYDLAFVLALYRLGTEATMKQLKNNCGLFIDFDVFAQHFLDALDNLALPHPLTLRDRILLRNACLTLITDKTIDAFWEDLVQASRQIHQARDMSARANEPNYYELRREAIAMRMH